MVTEATCLEATEKIQQWIPTAYYRGEENSKAWPKGCHLHTISTGVWLNRHHTGSSNNNAQQICNPRGIEN